MANIFKLSCVIFYLMLIPSAYAISNDCASLYRGLETGVFRERETLKQDPLSLRYIDKNSSEFQTQKAKILSEEKIRDRLTGEMFTKKEIRERQKKALERPTQYDEDPYTGLPIDLKSPLYKINQEIKNVSTLKSQTGQNLAPWLWLVQPAVPNNVKQSISYLVAEHLNSNLDMPVAVDTLEKIAKFHSVSNKEVFEDTFRIVRKKIADLEVQSATPAASEMILKLKKLDESIQMELKHLYKN